MPSAHSMGDEAPTNTQAGTGSDTKDSMRQQGTGSSACPVPKALVVKRQPSRKQTPAAAVCKGVQQQSKISRAEQLAASRQAEAAAFYKSRQQQWTPSSKVLAAGCPHSSTSPHHTEQQHSCMHRGPAGAICMTWHSTGACHLCSNADVTLLMAGRASTDALSANRLLADPHKHTTRL
jgi:hypothetical protein